MDPCSVGEERCGCYGNGTCDEPLTCLSGICVDMGGNAAGGAGNLPGQTGVGGESGGVPQGSAGSGGTQIGAGGTASSSGGASEASGGSDGPTGGTTASGAGTSGSEASGGGTTSTSGGEGSTTGGSEAATGGTTSTSGGTTSTSGGTTSTSGGTTSTSGGASTGGNDPGTGGREPVEHGNSGLIPSDNGDYVWDWDVSGVIGSWFTFADSEGSSIESVYENPSIPGAIGSNGGRMCFQGAAVGHLDEYWDTRWGAGVGLLVCAYPEDMSWLPEDIRSQADAEQSFLAEDCPTLLDGVNSVTFTVSGTWEKMRFIFSESEENTQPFVEIPFGDTYTLYPSDAEVPLWENEPNAGAVGSSNVLSLNFQIVSQTSTEAFEFCIEDLTIN